MPPEDWDLNRERNSAVENQLPDDDSLATVQDEKRRSLVRRFMALICLFAFLGLILANLNTLLGDLPPYLQQFHSLSSEEIVKKSRPAVVKVLAFNALPGSVAASPRQGTGFNIDPRGLIITNRHVLENCQEVRVVFSDGSSYPSNQFKFVGDRDLALVRLNTRDLPILAADYSRLPAAGELLTIVGDPKGYQGIPVQGSLAGYTTGEGGSSGVMVIRANIAPGNSGSPVLDFKGQVVGVVFAMTDSGPSSMALAIPLAGIASNLQWTSF
ncbi:MAG: serine protease [Syntrophomonadaceae bacterium]